mgnify:CR=1 FL=1
MRNIPTITGLETRRRFPWSPAARGLRVPLIPPKDGETHTGFLRVTPEMAAATLGTDLYQQKLNLLGTHLQRWVDWKAKQGWRLLGCPRWQGPHDPPVNYTGAEPEDCVWYVVSARFTRDVPVYVLLDDYLEIESRARRYRVDLHDPASWALPAPKDEITTAETPHDPMVDAAQRREAQEMPREDLTIPDLWDAQEGA